MNKKIKIVIHVLGVLFGIFVFFYGGYDDSPGAQLLGFLIALFSLIGLIRLRRHNHQL